MPVALLGHILYIENKCTLLLISSTASRFRDRERQHPNIDKNALSKTMRGIEFLQCQKRVKVILEIRVLKAELDIRERYSKNRSSQIFQALQLSV